MLRYLLLFLLLGSVLQAQTALTGKVTEEESNEPLIFATVGLFKNDVPIAGTETDLDGNYFFSNIDPGTYDLLVSYTGYQEQKIVGIVVLAGKTNRADVKMLNEGVMIETVVVTEYRAPLVEQDNTTSGQIVTSEQIKNLPTRNINALAATTAGLSSADEGGAINVRGSRSDATNYIIDGIRVQGNFIPETEIDQMQVITGGVEAQYGDVTGGIISITTKGPSNRFSSGVEMETSKFLDAYENSLVGFNMSGPILKNDQGQSILGYRFAGRYTYQLDDDPPAIDVFRIDEAKIAELEEDPLLNLRGNTFAAADFLEAEDARALDANPFEERERIDLTAKIDARLTQAIDVTFTGAFTNNENQFTPGGWGLLNSQNNPFSNSSTYRGNFRFRHRFGGGINSGSGQSKGIIRNASYILQGGFEKIKSDIADQRHGENYFNYGYIGNFDVEWIPTFVPVFDPETFTTNLVHTDYRQVLRGYTAGDMNPVLANYNKAMGIDFNSGEPLNGQIGNFLINEGTADGDLLALTNFFSPNGQLPNVYATTWNFHNNVGAVYNLVTKGESDIITFNGRASFTLVPGSSDASQHNIQLGVMYEERIQRGYNIFPRNLWNVARQQANNHILGIVPGADTVGTIEIPDFGTANLLEVTIDSASENQFFRKVRESLGVPLDQYVNVDGLSPEELRLEMFSARELNDENILNYFGYDYLGNPYNGTFEDFFTERDLSTGIRTFPVAPNRPLYFAGYIQDKFTFKDIIFRVGVRVDYYDANTKVLRDPYSLYSIMGANQYHAEAGTEKPGSVGDDYKVYLDDTGNSVLAYRDGDQWYEANGTPVNGPQEIAGIREGLVFPKYEDPNAQGNPNYIKQPSFGERDPNTGLSGIDRNFKDYEPQINIMPRLAFSFPISTNANFFAHYDILVQRPPSNTLATARDYFYFVDQAAGRITNNPDLKPERTIDYEVGFQQKISQNSALKIAAYYKELRDMIQQRTYFPVPNVIQYTTYDNQDFGTVKGFSLQYDLRKTPTNNFSLQANYTLQFADGTGSNPNSQSGLTDNGNLRTLFPLTFDERHRIVATLDYRYAGGSAYNGPRIGDLMLFANAGINFQTIAVSGRPYTATQTPTELGGAGTIGSINGARKPWNFTVNLRVDKTFQVRKGLFMNVYLRVSNLLDARNIINVYSATGSPTDTGFLQSFNGRRQIETIEDSARNLSSYLASYQWASLNADFFTLPRRMYAGATFSF